MHCVNRWNELDTLRTQLANPVRRVVDEGAEESLAKVRVILRKQEKAVPSFVNDRRRDHVVSWRGAGQPEELLEILEDAVSDFRIATKIPADSRLDIRVLIRHDVLEKSPVGVRRELGNTALPGTLRSHDPHLRNRDSTVGIVDKLSIVRMPHICLSVHDGTSFSIKQ